MTFSFEIYNALWWISQVFALVTLVFFIWCFQVKNKIRMMLLTGIGCLSFAISAAFLMNWSVAALFVLAAIRNFVFTYFDWRASKGRPIPRWLYVFFAVLFFYMTAGSTIVLWRLGMALWLEIILCMTLLGLIVGNILKGTNLMRISFILNRIFNIINHIHFNNLIGLVIAAVAIGSNFVFYIRMLAGFVKKRKRRGLPVLIKRCPENAPKRCATAALAARFHYAAARAKPEQEELVPVIG